MRIFQIKQVYLAKKFKQIIPSQTSKNIHYRKHVSVFNETL